MFGGSPSSSTDFGSFHSRMFVTSMRRWVLWLLLGPSGGPERFRCRVVFLLDFSLLVFVVSLMANHLVLDYE